MKIEVQHEETSDIIELFYHIMEIKTVDLPGKTEKSSVANFASFHNGVIEDFSSQISSKKFGRKIDVSNLQLISKRTLHFFGHSDIFLIILNEILFCSENFLFVFVNVIY